METMEIEFDSRKDRINRDKHGLSLADGVRIMEDPDHLIIPSIREIDGEERFKLIGMLNGKLHSAVFVWREPRMRFISVRRSNSREQRAYCDSL